MSLGSMIGVAMRFVTNYRDIERLWPQIIKVTTDAQRLLPQLQLVMTQTLELAAKIAPELMPAPQAQTATTATYDARWLQNSLNIVMGTNLVVDGIVGPRTQDAVRTFQATHGLVVDGWAGINTMAKLAELVEKRA